MVKSLLSNGADFIILNGTGKDPEFMLHSNGLDKPVFILDQEQEDFVTKILKRLPVNRDDTESLNSKFMRIQITFSSPTSSGNKAKVQFFYSPSNFLTFEYVRELEQVYQKLRDYIDFQPSVSLFRLPMNDENCISDGLYCAMDPDGDSGPLSGKDVVEESLFEACVFQKKAEAWFQYMTRFRDKCWMKMSSECSQQTLRLTSLSHAPVDRCIKESFSAHSQGKKLKNKILDQQLDVYR